MSPPVLMRVTEPFLPGFFLHRSVAAAVSKVCVQV